MAIWVPMTAMPQRTALSHALGQLPPHWWASPNTPCTAGRRCTVYPCGALGFEGMLLGTLTTTGSLIRRGKTARICTRTRFSSRDSRW